jgi:hypothetical protein
MSMPLSSDVPTLPGPDAFVPAAVAERVSKLGDTKSNLKLGKVFGW